MHDAFRLTETPYASSHRRWAAADFLPPKNFTACTPYRTEPKVIRLTQPYMLTDPPSLRQINSLLNRIHDSEIPRVSASITGLDNHDLTTAGARNFGLDVG